MKLEDGKSYGFGDIFGVNAKDVNKAVKPITELIAENSSDDNTLQLLEHPEILSQVCKAYIYRFQIIVDILYLTLIPLGIVLSIFVSYKYISISIASLFILRVFTYLIQQHHPFIKHAAKKNIKRTRKIINEYYDYCNK